MNKMKTELKESTKESKKEPSNKYSIFPITVTEWDNEGIKSFTIQKSYKDAKDEWQNTTSFNECDLAVISKILNQI